MAKLNKHNPMAQGIPMPHGHMDSGLLGKSDHETLMLSGSHEDLEKVRAFIRMPLSQSSFDIGKDYQKLLRGYISIINEAYRAKSRLDKTSDDDLPQNLKNLPRYIQKIWEQITAQGFEVRDYLNEPYSDGLPIEVLEFIHVESISKPFVTECIRPSIRLLQDGEQGKFILVQKGEVYVSVPAAE